MPTGRSDSASNRFAEDGRTALVVGASGGIGAALLAQLQHAGFARVHAWSRERPATLAAEQHWQACDLEAPETLAAAAATLRHSAWWWLPRVSYTLQSSAPSAAGRSSIRPG